jgi:hypothetical protein
VASSSGRRDHAGDDMRRDAARHRKPDIETDTHSGEDESAGPVFNSDGGQGHNEPEGSIISNLQRVEVSSCIECEVGTLSHSGVEQPMTTQAERHQQ